MKKKYIFLSVLATAVSVTTLTSCDDYLDTMPDNRTVLDTEDKMSDLLTSSYPANEYVLVNELMSDNADYYGAENPNGERLGDQIYFWKLPSLRMRHRHAFGRHVTCVLRMLIRCSSHSKSISFRMKRHNS